MRRRAFGASYCAHAADTAAMHSRGSKQSWIWRGPPLARRHHIAARPHGSRCAHARRPNPHPAPRQCHSQQAVLTGWACARRCTRALRTRARTRRRRRDGHPGALGGGRRRRLGAAPPSRPRASRGGPLRRWRLRWRSSAAHVWRVPAGACRVRRVSGGHALPYVARPVRRRAGDSVLLRSRRARAGRRALLAAVLRTRPLSGRAAALARWRSLRARARGECPDELQLPTAVGRGAAVRPRARAAHGGARPAAARDLRRAGWRARTRGAARAAWGGRRGAAAAGAAAAASRAAARCAR